MMNGEKATLERDGKVFAHEVADDAIIYKGAMVVLDGLVAKPAYASATLKPVGIAQFSARTGEMVRAKLSTYFIKNHGADPVLASQVGELCYAIDDETVGASDAGGTLSKAGIVRGVEDSGVWVEFN